MSQLFELVSIKTKDGVSLAGLFAAPKNKPKAGIIWVHGLTGAFWHSTKRTRVLASQATHSGYAFAIFNNRGHDIADDAQAADGKPYFIGGGFEKFTDCVKDIDAMVVLMQKRGIKEIYLAGHSTGANKIAYYAAHKPSRVVKGLMFIAGLTDVKPLDAKQRALLAEANRIAQKNPAAVLPYEKFGMLICAQRFTSLFTPGSPEDTFPYHGLGGEWSILRRIKLPTAVIIGSKDEHLSISLENYLGVVEENLINSPVVTLAVIKGASHGFKKKEAELADSVMAWIKSL